MTSISTVLRKEFELKDLPIRAISLDEGALSQIFGGCKGINAICDVNKKNDCCEKCSQLPGGPGGVCVKK
jgi:hypothetical protein